MNGLKKFFDRDFYVHLTKFVLVGALNAAFTFVLYWILLKPLSMSYLVAYPLSWFCGVIMTYVINFLWVFKPEQKLEFRRRFKKYVVVYLTSLLVGQGGIMLLHQLIDIDPFWLAFFVVPIVVIINFIGIKYWALRKTR